MLAQIGIAADKIETVIISHLHYDHAGTLDTFPSARFHIQEAEMAYATGPCMCEEAMRKPFTADHVCSLVQHVQLLSARPVYSPKHSLGTVT